MAEINWDLVPVLNDTQIVGLRAPKNNVTPHRPYAFLAEQERASTGDVVNVATIFLTNRECPFRCLFCDLWKNTTDERVPRGAIPQQLQLALAELPPCQSIKLYNSGNFFDRQAIPPEDHDEIAQLVRTFDTVVVENHPSLCNEACLRFRDRLSGNLEIAIGLETAHPEVLARVNKRMSRETFQQAVEFLVREQISVRSFILLRPPYLTEELGREWAIRSLEFAFDCGVECCTIIPTRSGNGALEQLAATGHFRPPQLASLEAAFTSGLQMNRGRLFVDLCDFKRISRCPTCTTAQQQRLQDMNLTQRVLPPIPCEDC